MTITIEIVHRSVTDVLLHRHQVNYLADEHGFKNIDEKRDHYTGDENRLDAFIDAVAEVTGAEFNIIETR